MIEPDPDDPASTLIFIKAVPGSRKDQIVGPLGNRLKVKVSAPPEGGKANRAICDLIAGTLGVRPRDVEVVTGASAPEKTVRVRGVRAEAVRGLYHGPA